MDRYPGIPDVLTELIERLDTHPGLADHTAEAAALRQELQASCSPKEWEAFLKLEEALQMREKALFDVVIEFFLLPDDWDGPFDDAQAQSCNTSEP